MANNLEFSKAADQRSKTLVALAGGLLLLTPSFLNNFDTPHEHFWLIAACTILAACSVVCGTLAVLIADANSRKAAAGEENLSWAAYHRSHGLCAFLFAFSVVSFSTFSILNASDFSETDFGPVDILESEQVAGPEKVLMFTADAPGLSTDATYEWSASAGRLFDRNQKTVAWISPEPAKDPEWITIQVIIRDRGVTKSTTSTILFIGAGAKAVGPSSEPGESPTKISTPHVLKPYASHQTDKLSACARKSMSLNAPLQRLTRYIQARQNVVSWSNPPTVSAGTNGLGDLGDLRPCCSTSPLLWPLCNPRC